MPSLPRPITASVTDQNPTLRSSIRSRLSFGSLSVSPLAHESIRNDLAAYAEENVETNGQDGLDGEFEEAVVLQDDRPYSMASSYRRPSFVSFGGSRPVVAPQFENVNHLTKEEIAEVRDEERKLLVDNHLIAPESARVPDQGFRAKIYNRVFRGEGSQAAGNISDASHLSENTALLADHDEDVENQFDIQERENRAWEMAVKAGKIKTTWQREAKTLVRYSSPLIVTFFLQYSLTMASIFTVGRLGKAELGAVSLASMTANITGYAVYQGLATSLDTLCAQAYGSGRKHLVGLQLQRMVYFLWIVTIPICFIWFYSQNFLRIIVPEQESAMLAAQYLRILIFGAPGYAAFESGKRFVQAQGLFSASTYVLLIAAPLNAFMNWLFVWKFGWGFIGAPIAVAITDNLLPLLLFLYVFFIDGRQCWDGLSKRAFQNWAPMIWMSLPGLFMLEAEFIAFEVLILASSYFSATHLAAQSVLSTVLSLAFQIPFPMSIAACTRVANLIGATLSDAARTSAKVAFYGAFVVGIFNFLLLLLFRDGIARLFTNDEGVIALVVKTMPVCAAFQLYNAFTAIANGLLRGIGMQSFGSWTNIICYYLVAMPISFGTAFALHWELSGLWAGVAIALGLIALIEAWALYTADWDLRVKEAQARNAAA